jgi:deoxyribodipyrimidine photo-lyase
LPEYLKPVPALKVRRRLVGQAPGLPLSARGHAPPSLTFRGGRLEAEKRLAHFVQHNLPRYASVKNEPGTHATSDLSPYLHFGFISSLEVALAVEEAARRHHWMAGEFLEERIVRWEVAFNFARHAARVDSLEALPPWARASLRKHAQDSRDPVYSGNSSRTPGHLMSSGTLPSANCC